MFGGRRRRVMAVIRLAGGICLLGQAATGQSPPSSRPAQAAIVATVSVDLGAAEARRQPAKACLGGSQLLAAISAGPTGAAAWELRCDKVVIGQGMARLDGMGRGQASVTVPDVLARAEATFSVMHAGRDGSLRIDILPAAMLRDVRATLRDRGLGIIDPRGLVQAAMTAQEVAFTDLGPQLENDFFRGGIVILAGFEDANMLADACRRLAVRVHQGMSLLVLVPPVGWTALGVRRTELAALADVHLAKGFASTIKEADLGPCRLTGAMTAYANATELIWCYMSGGAMGGGPAARYTLGMAQPLGKGVVLAATLPQLADCYADAVGRCMLSEIMMWILKRSAGPKEHKAT